MEEGRWELVVWVMDAMFNVAPKGLGFVIGEVLNRPEGLVGYMWGCSGKLGNLEIELGMPKSNEVVAKAATGFVGAGLAAGCYECS